MTIINLPFKIERDQQTLKKQYINLKDGSISSAPKGMPKWKDIQTGHNKLSPCFAIRPDDDLVVIDCDSLETTQELDDIVPYDPNNYIVISDKGEKHFYFKPSEYYRNSPIYSKTRIKAGPKIDILHGESLIYAVSPLNATKSVYQGTSPLQDYDILPEIPDNVVDYLANMMQRTLTAQTDDDYHPVISYMGPQLDVALAQYARTRAYSTLQSVITLLTPSKFKQDDCHPDNIADGNGYEYINAFIGRLGRDPSISEEQAVELLTIITQELWSSPLPQQQLDVYLNGLASRRYPNGRPVFIYDPNATNQPLISANGAPYMPVYRTLDDQYVIALQEGGVEIIKGFNLFKRALLSKNYAMLVDREAVTSPTQVQNATTFLDTVTLVNRPYEAPGIIKDGSRLLYNEYRPTKFLGIIRGEFLSDRVYEEGSTPTIDALIENLTRDHPPESLMQSKLLQFLSHKMKTLDYSPIVFQVKGNRGTGKNSLLTLLDMITDASMLYTINANGSQFNAELKGKMFISLDEFLITKDSINTLKKLSGDMRIKIEAKGKDAITERNIATFFALTNSPHAMAETRDDRRFVTLSSFTSPRIDYIINGDLGTKIAMELEQWCLKLRDIKLSSPKIYTDANAWHDSIHYDAFEAKAEAVQDPAGKLANMIYKIDSLNSDQIYSELETIFGAGFHYKVVRGDRLNVYLLGKKGTRRRSDGSIISHNITKAHLEAQGLAMYVKADKNLREYDSAIFYIQLDLLPQQLERFTEDSVAPLEID